MPLKAISTEAVERILASTKGSRWTVLPHGHTHTHANCRCVCGTVKLVSWKNIKRKLTKSCGCYRKTFGVTHGMSKSGTYKSWNNMIARCTNPHHWAYKYYGGAGITVYKPWLNFANFLKAMGQRPSPQYSIERHNNNSGYRPGNCYWATHKEQMANTRRSLMVKAFGVTRPLQKWVDQLHLNYATVHYRLRTGMKPEKALTSPPGSVHRRGLTRTREKGKAYEGIRHPDAQRMRLLL